MFAVEDCVFTTEAGADWYAKVRGLLAGTPPEVSEVDVDDDLLPPDDDFLLYPVVVGFFEDSVIAAAVVDPIDFDEGVWGEHDDNGFTGEVHMFAYAIDDVLVTEALEIIADDKAMREQSFELEAL